MVLLVLVASALMAGVKAEEDTAVATSREAIGETFMGALIIIGQCRRTVLMYAKLHYGFHWSTDLYQRSNFPLHVPVSSMLVVSHPTDRPVVPSLSYTTMVLLVLLASALMAGVQAEEETAVATSREAIGETFIGALIIIGYFLNLKLGSLHPYG